MGVSGQHHTPPAVSPRITYYPLYRKLGGSHGHSEWVQKFLPLPGFDPWTVQPVASHYTNCAILALFILNTVHQNLLVTFDEIQYCETIKSCNYMKPIPNMRKHMKLI
jgi:hypothetical protein